jgi:vancomycin permeability regulator SanA
MKARIIIFGAALLPDGTPSVAMRRRVSAAVRLAVDWPGAIFIPTGGQTGRGPPEWQAMRTLLTAEGVSPDHIEPERTAMDTLDSVLACHALLAKDAGPVYVATSRFHLPRCVLLLWLAGIPAQPVPIGPSTEPNFWRRWHWRLREVPALIWDALLLFVWQIRRKMRYF